MRIYSLAYLGYEKNIHARYNHEQKNSRCAVFTTSLARRHLKYNPCYTLVLLNCVYRRVYVFESALIFLLCIEFICICFFLRDPFFNKCSFFVHIELRDAKKKIKYKFLLFLDYNYKIIHSFKK